MSTRNLKAGFVVPGDKLGVVEQFMPGPGTYESQGNIYSKVIGEAKVDAMNKTVSVIMKAKVPVVPEVGALTVGVVTNTQEKMATVGLYKIGEHRVPLPFTGILHISASSQRFERNMADVCKPGDLLRARIVSVNNRVPQLTTAERSLGVVLAHCSYCGRVLRLRDRTLECENCRTTERRRLAEDYGAWIP